MTTVTLYGKPDCPLCDKAESQLRSAIDESDVSLEIVDITQDDDLYVHYWAQIPVVAFEDGPTLYAPIGDDELIRALGSCRTTTSARRRDGPYGRR